MGRDTLQVISAVISAATLLVIVRKSRKFGGWRTWLPFGVVSALTLLFYVAVLLGWLGSLSSDVSATLRLTTQISLLFYAWYMPPGSGR